MNHCAAALIATLGVFSSLAEGAETPAPAPLTVEEATAEALNWSPALSPSGRYVALARRQGRVDMVVVADLGDPASKPFVQAVPNGIVRWIHWTSDDRLLFAAHYWINSEGKSITLDEVDRHGGIHLGRLVAMDRDGRNYVMLFKDNIDASLAEDLTRVSAYLPDDPHHIIAPAWTAGRVDLYRVDVDTGASRRLAKGNGSTLLWFADRNGYPAFRIDRHWTGRYAYVYARKGPGDVPPADLEWEKVDRISLRSDDTTYTPDFYPLWYGPQPNSYYVAARPDGADASGIYLYDFIEKKYLKTLATQPGIDVDTAFIDQETSEFLGATYYTDRKVTRLADAKLQAHFDALDKYFGGEVDVYLHDYDRDMQNWLLYTVGPRDRGSWHVYRVKDKSVREVAHWTAALEPARLGKATVLRYRARDGLEVMGYLTTPPTGMSPERPPPLILMPHGGPELRDTRAFDPFVQLLASRGYQVFQPNFRGSSGFGKHFADAGKRQWGGAMQDDLTDAFEYLVQNGHAARDRACIVGGSYGGYAALAAATQTPGLYRCAVSIAGISDLPRQLKADKRSFRGDAEVWEYMKRQIGDPDDDEAMLEAHSPARFASAVQIPVLLIHGEDDQRVPIEQSELMDKALRKAGKDVRFVRIKSAGHALDNDDWKQVYPAILEFLDKNLPVVPAATATAEAPK